MGSHDPFGHFKHKLWPKEGPQIDSRPSKVWNHPDFLACRWRATYCWKAFNEEYNFASELISIKILNTNLWAPKVVKVPVVRISRFPFGNPKTK